jgi:hypothetical protein
MLSSPKEDLRIKTANVLESTQGMIVPVTNLNNRKPGMLGRITGYVPGHGGDVWWVEHDEDHLIAPYSVMEMSELAEQPFLKREIRCHVCNNKLNYRDKDIFWKNSEFDDHTVGYVVCSCANFSAVRVIPLCLPKTST